MSWEKAEDCVFYGKYNFLWEYNFDIRPGFQGQKTYRDGIPEGRGWDEALALPGLQVDMPNPVL